MERQVELSAPVHGRVRVSVNEKTGSLCVYKVFGKSVYIRKEDIPKLRDWLNKLEVSDGATSRAVFGAGEELGSAR